MPLSFHRELMSPGSVMRLFGETCPEAAVTECGSSGRDPSPGLFPGSQEPVSL